MDHRDHDNEIVLQIAGKSYRPYICILVAVLSTLVQILSSSVSENVSIIVTLYFNIVLVLVAIYFIDFYGVLAATLSSLIFSITIGQDWINTCIVVFANFLQAVLLFVFCKYYKKQGNGAPKTKVIHISWIFLLILGVFYLFYNLSTSKNFLTSSIIIFTLMVIVHVYRAISDKDVRALLYVLLLLLPNAVGALLGSLQIDNGSINWSVYTDNFVVWSLSNSILILSFGYLFITFLKPKKEVKKEVITLKLSTALFYCSTIIWNAIIYIMYIMGWLDKSMSSYVFPWMVGTIFFLMNMYYSTYSETDGETDKMFEWFEKRAVVAENNTQMLVAIISFLLPICAQLLGTITFSISVLFILNITAAIISIGLIWIPHGQIRHMATIKHVKTVFHLFTLSLLLLNIVLIINESIGA